MGHNQIRQAGSLFFISRDYSEYNNVVIEKVLVKNGVLTNLVIRATVVCGFTGEK